jgi:hypothetical protein
MDIDKWRSGKREIENFDSFYRKFEGAENLVFTQFATIPAGATMRMRYIDLIDWTSMKNQLSVDYAKPHLQLLCLSGVQISLDAFSGSDPQI